MPIEVEAKAHAKDLDSIEKKILEMGGKLVWQGEEKDTYFAHPVRDFAKTDEALRVREEEGKYFLTYKGPKLDSETKTREEIAIRVDDFQSITDILKNLGFNEYGVVKKHRKKMLLGKYEVCLDSVGNLGEFVEIEILTPSHLMSHEVDELREEVLEILGQLGLTRTERRSYLELLYPES